MILKNKSVIKVSHLPHRGVSSCVIKNQNFFLFNNIRKYFRLRVQTKHFR